MADPTSAAETLGTTTPAPAAPLPELSYDAAMSMKSELLGNPQWRDKYMAGDIEAKSTMDRIVRGLTPKQAPPSDPTSREQMVDWLRERADIGEEVAQQIKNNLPVSPAERQLAEQHKQKCFRDKAWVARYLDGDRHAATELAHINIVLAAPVRDPSTT